MTIIVHPLRYWQRLLDAKGKVVAVYADNAILAQTYDLVNSTRVSNDTGKFVPGIFRVNGYEIGKEFTNSVNSGEMETLNVLSNGYSVYFKVTGNFARYAHNYSLWKRPVLADLSYDRDVTLQKAYAKLGQSLFSGGENLGELKQTIQMIRNPLKDLRNFLTRDGLKNLKILKEILVNRRSPNKLLALTGKTVASSWLELRYGLRPLALSIKEIVGLVNAKVAQFEPNTVRTVRSKMKSVRFVAADNQYGNIAQLLVKGKHTCKHRIRTTSIVYFKQSAELSLAKKLGLELAYLPETAWELTRLSFVVDWFFTIGPWLGAFRVKPEFSVLGSTTSHKVSSSGRVFPVSVSGGVVGSKVLKKDFGPPLLYSSEWFYRTVNSGGPPSLPIFRRLDGLDYLKSLDGLALIMQGFLHKLR